ncbi:DNA internalization-related competence protein ComEC/Rec2 [Oscillibacter sp. MSJ-2]|uniref:DNA internalization-related competence protein ComEC/Rec2 n=1 Tax=Dysosmobacter acutus TaxID=2841504 RepID=A0ABS6FB56_9FIRM|nr:DNA internalization-related competence protein ComEC/Rec2 [Dysosmobacter acutus]MBU5627313.1 DNA internalization-related competence protein ComEC/Rec2 [Dysosmobacter acutus]
MRKLAAFGFSFAVGVFAVQYLLPGRYVMAAGLGALALGISASFLRGFRRTRVMLILIGVGIGLVYSWGYAKVIQEPYLRQAETLRRNLTMEVCSWPERSTFGAKVTVRIGPFGKAVYYGDEKLLSLSPGDAVTGDVYLTDASSIRGNELTTFTSRGVWLLAYSRGEAVVEPGRGSARYLSLHLKKRFQDQIDLLFTGDSRSMMRALLTGDRGDMPEHLSSDLEESGLYHVTAVSGMHCTILLSLVTALTGKHRRRLKAAVGMAVLVLYMLMVGCTPSVVRSVVMNGCLLSAPLFRRDGDPPTSLATALLVILLQNPFAAASISLQLSFSAAAGILWLTPKLWPKGEHGGVIRFIAGSFAVTAGALVFTIPLSAYYFDFFVVVAPLSNLLCLEAVSGQFLFGLMAVLVSYICLPLGQALSFISAGLGWYVLDAARLLSAIPYHALYFCSGYLKYWLVYAYAAFGICAVSGAPRRRYIFAAAGCVLTLILTVHMTEEQMTGGKMDLFVLDVGQGQSVLMVSRGRTALVDCGSGNTFRDAGGTAADYLNTIGERKLDYLVLSHYDTDHANGVERLLARVDVGTMLVPEIESEYGEALRELAQEHGVQVEGITEERRYALGEAELTVYPPVGSGSSNEEGLTALCSCGEFDLLATGDMDSATERKLIESVPLPDVEVLLAGHHGSRHSTSTELLKAVMPEAAVISAGENSYGHPSKEALRRLVLEDVEVFRTDLQGTIHISVN